MGLQKLEIGYSARRQPIAPPSRTLGRVRAHAGMYVHHTMSAATDIEYNRTHTLSKVRAMIFPPPSDVSRCLQGRYLCARWRPNARELAQSGLWCRLTSLEVLSRFSYSETLSR
jgi:hypothetical protein